jgi:hypothetical protein
MLLANAGMLTFKTIKFETHATHHSTTGRDRALILRAAVHHDLNVSVTRRLVAKVEHRLRPGRVVGNFGAGSASSSSDTGVAGGIASYPETCLKGTVCHVAGFSRMESLG